MQRIDTFNCTPHYCKHALYLQTEEQAEIYDFYHFRNKAKLVLQLSSSKKAGRKTLSILGGRYSAPFMP